MLSLTVKEGDYIMIGDSIRVQFFQDLSAKSMKIGIDAPRSVNIVRNKPYENALLEDAERNAGKLEEIELQKRSQVLALEKSKEKERLRREKRAREKAEEESNYAASVI